MKQFKTSKFIMAFMAILLMSVAANTAFGIGILPCASGLMAGSLLLSFLPSRNACLQTIVPSIFEIKTYGYGAKRAPKHVSRRFPGASRFGSAAYLTDAEKAEQEKKEKEKKEGEVEIKTAADVLKHLTETKANLEESVKTEVKAEVKAATEEKLAEIEKKITEVKGLPETVTAADLVKMLDEHKVNTKTIDRMLITMKSVKAAPAGKTEVKTFNQILDETIEKHANEIKNFKRNSPVLIMDMMPEAKEVNSEGVREVKEVGDMSIAANFPGAGQLFQDVGPLIESPYNRVWLGDILPGGTSTGTQLVYPKENGSEGGAGVWEDPTTDKPQMDWDLVPEPGYFKWIAGIVIVDRAMLDDIAFLRSYITNKMLISLKTAENAFILNGTSSSQPVPGLNSVASAYNGDFSNRVDRIIDAAYGQIVDATHEFYQGNTTVLRPRDAVKIGLNKSTGSGEYDLPAGSVAFVNGKLTIGGLQVVPTTQMAFDTFLSFDKNATMFVKRMQPELRMFEDAALAKKNKVMFRIEERATLAIFNNAAIVKGVLQLS